MGEPPSNLYDDFINSAIVVAMKFPVTWSKRKGILLACAFFAPLLAWTIWERVVDIRFKPLLVTGTLQAKEIAVGSKVGGRIKTIAVREGQEIKLGDVILTFETPELDARAQQLKDQIAMQQAELKELLNGPRPNEIAAARAALAEAGAQHQMMIRGYRKEEIESSIHKRHEAKANLDLLRTGYRKEDIQRECDIMEEAHVRADWLYKDWKRYEQLADEGAISRRDAEDLKSKYDAAQRVYLAAKQSYAKMKSGPRQEEITAAQERFNSLVEQERLMLRGYRPEEIEVAKQRYLSAKAHLELLIEGTRFERIERARASLNRDEAVLSELEAQLKDKVVLAPADSEVSVMDLHIGELIPPNKAVATLTRLDDVWTRVYIPTRELARIATGQTVDVHVDAFPGRVFKGKIVQIPGMAEFTPRNIQTAEERSQQVFGLKVQLDNPDHLLRGGMNAEVVLPPIYGPLAGPRIAGVGNGRSNSSR